MAAFFLKKSMVVVMTIIILFHSIYIFWPNFHVIHINVEVCALVDTIKCIHKYIYKEHDSTMFSEMRKIKSKNTWMPDIFLHLKLTGFNMHAEHFLMY